MELDKQIEIMNFEDKTELFVCQCHDVSHQLILSILANNEDREVYCSYHLDALSIGDRVKNACSFLLGKERRDGDFGCLLVKKEDADRLACFLDYLGDESIPSSSCNDEKPLPYIEGNASKKWQVTPLFTYDMESKEYIHTLSICRIEFITEPSLGMDYEVSHKVSIKKSSIGGRIVKSIKYICGYRSCYGDFDSFTLTSKDVVPLRKFVTLLKTIEA